jgi:hypothetical protein
MNLIDNQLNKNITDADIVKIFQRVLLQIFTDLISRSKHPSYESFRKKAFDWFFAEEHKNDFEIICEISGFNPHKIKKKAALLLEKSGGLFKSQTTTTRQ